MIIKLQSAYDRAVVYVNMEHIKYFYKTLDITYPGTTLVYTDGSSSKVKEFPEEIMGIMEDKR